VQKGERVIEAETRVCKKCGEGKALDQFSIVRGLYRKWKCKNCISDHRNARRRERYKSCPEFKEKCNDIQNHRYRNDPEYKAKCKQRSRERYRTLSPELINRKNLLKREKRKLEPELARERDARSRENGRNKRKNNPEFAERYKVRSEKYRKNCEPWYVNNLLLRGQKAKFSVELLEVKKLQIQIHRLLKEKQ